VIVPVQAVALDPTSVKPVGRCNKDSNDPQIAFSFHSSRFWTSEFRRQEHHAVSRQKRSFL
jgi:hypothetical protein